jgi:hypothetical protein
VVKALSGRDAKAQLTLTATMSMVAVFFGIGVKHT